MIDEFQLSIEKWMSQNRSEMLHVIDKKIDCRVQYTCLMRDATPHKCEYGSLLEAFVFAKSKNVNLFVYIPDDSIPYFYRKMAQIITDLDVKTECIVYLEKERHY